jgi:hypothetical protein
MLIRTISDALPIGSDTTRGLDNTVRLIGRRHRFRPSFGADVKNNLHDFCTAFLLEELVLIYNKLYGRKMSLFLPAGEGRFT